MRETRFISARSALGGPSVCGALQPFTVSATANGWVQMQPAALLRCQMVPAVEDWTQRVVIPAARYYYGVQVAELKVAGSFSCRPMNNVSGSFLSEHGHANAVDISGFVLADGRVVTVKAAGRAAMPTAPSCAPCIGGPATFSPPCSAPTTIPTITTTSTSILPAMAASGPHLQIGPPFPCPRCMPAKRRLQSTCAGGRASATRELP